MTADGTVMGTPYYMTPEQARGLAQEIGPATDMWPIGLIAQKMLTAAIYWTARTHAELMVQMLAGGLPAPSARWPELGEAFDRWFARSCNREPAQRWSSVTEQVAALAEAVRSVKPTANGRARASFAEVAAAVHRPGATAAAFEHRSGTPNAAPRAASPWSGGPAAASPGHIPSGSIAGAGVLTRTAPTQRSSRSLGVAIAAVVALGPAGPLPDPALPSPSPPPVAPPSPAPPPPPPPPPHPPTITPP